MSTFHPRPSLDEADFLAVPLRTFEKYQTGGLLLLSSRRAVGHANRTLEVRRDGRLQATVALDLGTRIYVFLGRNLEELRWKAQVI